VVVVQAEPPVLVVLEPQTPEVVEAVVSVVVLVDPVSFSSRIILHN
jgi:hypothetical protein